MFKYFFPSNGFDFPYTSVSSVDLSSNFGATFVQISITCIMDAQSLLAQKEL